MPGIIPDAAASGLVVRTQEGEIIDQPTVRNAYIPSEDFSTTCDLAYLPSDCSARISPSQINAFQSEMICLAETLNPTGTWNCESLCNLSTAFSAWIEEYDPSNWICSLEPSEPSEETVLITCTGGALGQTEIGALVSEDDENRLSIGSDGMLFSTGGLGDMLASNNLSEVDPEAARDNLELGTLALRNDEDVIFRVPTYAALKATNNDLIKSVYVTDPNRYGHFEFMNGNFSANVASDPTEGFYIVANDKPATVAAWVRQDSRGEIDGRVFGIKGDMVTDDRAAIQAAVNYCNTFYPAPTLRLPGICRISGSISFHMRGIDSPTAADWFVIKGGGLHVTTMNVTVLTANGVWSNAPLAQNVLFDEVKFTSTAAANNTTVLDENKLIRFSFQKCSFDKVRMANATQYMQSLYISGCNIRYWTGTFFYSPNGNYDIKFTDNLIEHGVDFLIMGDQAAARTVAGCSIKGNCIEGLTGTGIRYGGARGLDISGNYFEGNAGADINSNYFATSATSRGVSMRGNLFAQTDAHKADPAYASVVWGRHEGAESSGNVCDGRFHLLTAGAIVDIGSDSVVPPGILIHPSSVAPAPGESSFRLVSNKGTVISNRVYLGAVNSGGTGSRALCIPN